MSASFSRSDEQRKDSTLSSDTATLHQPETHDEEKRSVSDIKQMTSDIEKQPEGIATPTLDCNIVDWDGPNDAADPMNWSESRKWVILGVISAITFDVAMASTIFAPGVPQAMEEFNTSDSATGALLVSIYIIGLAVGPLVLSPLSELYGRLYALNIANIVFLVASILSAVSVNVAMLLVFRLIMGLACAIPLTSGGGVVADLMPPEKRGTALTIWTIGPLLGPVIGPAAGGYLTLKAGWRWTFWLIVIIAGISVVGGFAFLKETYAPRLLELKARRLRAETGNSALRSKYDNGKTARQLFGQAVIRPSKLLIQSPIVLILSLFVAIIYGYMYMLFTTITDVFENSYGFNSGGAGLAYLGMGIGFCIGQVSLGMFTDKYMERQKARNGTTKPEDRLPPVILGSFLVPIGIILYGWSTRAHTHWIVPEIGLLLIGIAILWVFLPVQLYLVDAYTLYATSAIAANVVVRSVFGVVLPLAGPALYRRLGLGWGNTLLGLIALVFAPASILLLKYGEAIRNKRRFQPNL